MCCRQLPVLGDLVRLQHLVEIGSGLLYLRVAEDHPLPLDLEVGRAFVGLPLRLMLNGDAPRECFASERLQQRLQSRAAGVFRVLVERRFAQSPEINVESGVHSRLSLTPLSRVKPADDSAIVSRFGGTWPEGAEQRGV